MSIIGCVVNGQGEAKQTEIGITGSGKDNHMLYLNGLETEKVMTKDMINKIVSLVEEKVSVITDKLMLPQDKIQNLIHRHLKLEKELSSGEIDKKYADISKEYSDLNDIIKMLKNI